MLLPYSSNVHFTSFSSTFPSKSSIVFALLLSLLLLVVFRVAYICVLTFVRGSRGKQSVEASQSKAISSWSLFTLESLPLTFSMPSPGTVGQGVGLQRGTALVRNVPRSQPAAALKVPETAQLNWQTQRGGSVDGNPPPNTYQSQVPLSMAKIIMSRHTFRRPVPQPSRRAASLPPSPVRQQSMV